MKKVIFSLAFAAIGYSSFADIILNGNVGNVTTTTTTNPDGSSTCTTTLNCTGDGTCATIKCSMIDPNGNPMPGGQISLNVYQNNQNILSQSGTLNQYQSYPDPQNGTDYYFQIWNPVQGK